VARGRRQLYGRVMLLYMPKKGVTLARRSGGGLTHTRNREDGVAECVVTTLAAVEGWLRHVHALGSQCVSVVVQVLKLGSETVTSIKWVKSTTPSASTSMSSLNKSVRGAKAAVILYRTSCYNENGLVVFQMCSRDFEMGK
jgi:hypothetical protein